MTNFYFELEFVKVAITANQVQFQSNSIFDALLRQYCSVEPHIWEAGSLYRCDVKVLRPIKVPVVHVNGGAPLQRH